MTKVTFYAYFLKCITLNISSLIKYSTVKAVKSLALKVRSLLTSLTNRHLYCDSAHNIYSLHRKLTKNYLVASDTIL